MGGACRCLVLFPAFSPLTVFSLWPLNLICIRPLKFPHSPTSLSPVQPFQWDDLIKTAPGLEETSTMPSTCKIISPRDPRYWVLNTHTHAYIFKIGYDINLSHCSIHCQNISLRRKNPSKLLFKNMCVCMYINASCEHNTKWLTNLGQYIHNS